MTTTTPAHSLCSMLLLCLFMTGCANMINPPRKPFTGYAAQERISLRVGVNVTEELLKAKWQMEAPFGPWIIPIGPSIATNANVLARHVFAQAVAMSPTRPPQSPVDAVLTPLVAYINRTEGASVGGKNIVAIKVEWTLRDPNGGVIWADTVSGEGTGTAWTDQEDIVKAALEDLLTKSHQAISSAVAIRQFTAKTGRP